MYIGVCTYVRVFAALRVLFFLSMCRSHLRSRFHFRGSVFGTSMDSLPVHVLDRIVSYVEARDVGFNLYLAAVYFADNVYFTRSQCMQQVISVYEMRLRVLRTKYVIQVVSFSPLVLHIGE